MSPTPIHQVLDNREQTHGSFLLNTAVMQALKDECRAAPNWHKLVPNQKEAIEMICHKLGRILCGNPDTPDHWLDVSGYATLAHDLISPQ